MYSIVDFEYYFMHKKVHPYYAFECYFALITHKPNHTNARHMKKGEFELFTSPER